MKKQWIIDLAYRDSIIHRVPAWLKLGAVLGVVALTLAYQRWWLLGGLGGMVITGLLLSRIPVWVFVRKLLLFEPLVICVSLAALYQPDGLHRFIFLATRATLCVAAMLLMSCTTPFERILDVFRTLRMPALLITTLSLTQRYLFVLSDESARMRRARLSRTFDATRSPRWKSLSSVISHLFVRASERAERIYNAMVSRGWKWGTR